MVALILHVAHEYGPKPYSPDPSTASVSQPAQVGPGPQRMPAGLGNGNLRAESRTLSPVDSFAGRFGESRTLVAQGCDPRPPSVFFDAMEASYRKQGFRPFAATTKASKASHDVDIRQLRGLYQRTK